jgi:hypothetical protein
MYNKIEKTPLLIAIIMMFTLSTPSFAQITGMDGMDGTSTGLLTGAETEEVYGSSSKVTKEQCAEWLSQFNSWMSKANDKVAAATSSKDLQVARGYKDSAAGYRNKIAANQGTCDDYAGLDTQLKAWREACLEKNKQFGGGPFTCS